MGAFATTVNSSTSRAVPCRAVPATTPSCQSVEELLFQRTVFFFFFLALLRCLHLHLHRGTWSQGRLVWSVLVSNPRCSLSRRLASSRVASKLSKGRLGGTGLVGRTAQHSTAQRRAAQHTGRLRQDVAGRTGGSTGSAQDSPRRLTGTVAWWPGGLVVVTHHGESTF